MGAWCVATIAAGQSRPTPGPQHRLRPPKKETLLPDMGRTLCTQFGRHTHYANGAGRPRYRGWLLGCVTAVTIPVVLVCICLGLIRPSALPAILAICFTLCSSSTLHLYPFISIRSWEVARRLDRVGILLINATSYLGPQLTSLDACKPPAWLSLSTVVAPNVVGAAFVLSGAEGPLVFIGAGIAAVSTTLFWASYDWLLASHSCFALLFYGSGLMIHAMQPAKPAELWGHHEWAHVLVTLGLVTNAVVVLHLAETCE